MPFPQRRREDVSTGSAAGSSDVSACGLHESGGKYHAMPLREYEMKTLSFSAWRLDCLN
jgi:hypothetical protein